MYLSSGAVPVRGATVAVGVLEGEQAASADGALVAAGSDGTADGAGQLNAPALPGTR